MLKKMVVSCVLVGAAALSGCRTVDINANHDFQGKVWRAEIYARMSASLSFVEGEKLSGDAAAFVERTKWSKDILAGMRTAPVRFRENDWAGTWHWLKVTIPDSMDSTDVQKGAIVDVMFERSLDYHYPSYRINRIVRVVCKATETECIERIKKEKSLNTVIDANPVPGNHYGNTYTHKLSQAEADAFNAWLKK